MTFSDIVNSISFLIPIISIIGIIIGFYYRAKLSGVYKSFTIYLCLMICFELMTKFLGSLGNNLIVLPLYSLIELSFFLFLYNKYLLRRKKVFIIIGTIGILYIIGEIFSFFVVNQVDAKQFQPYSKVVDNFIIIIMSLGFFLERVNRYKETGWDYFQLNTILLIFFTITLIVFLPFNFLINENTGLKFYFWLTNIIMVILFYIYITYSIWKNGRMGKEPDKK